jgi:hypothetical protein
MKRAHTSTSSDPDGIDGATASEESSSSTDLPKASSRITHAELALSATSGTNGMMEGTAAGSKDAVESFGCWPRNDFCAVDVVLGAVDVVGGGT